jgi:hypothetical protein
MKRRTKFVLDGLHRYLLIFITIMVVYVWATYFILDTDSAYKMMFSFGFGFLLAIPASVGMFLLSLKYFPIKINKVEEEATNGNNGSN